MCGYDVLLCFPLIELIVWLLDYKKVSTFYIIIISTILPSETHYWNTFIDQMIIKVCSTMSYDVGEMNRSYISCSALCLGAGSGVSDTVTYQPGKHYTALSVNQVGCVWYTLTFYCPQ